MTRRPLPADFKLERADPLFLITLPSRHLRDDQGTTALDAVLRALGGYGNAAMVFTGVKQRPRPRCPARADSRICRRRPRKRVAVTSLGQARYLGLMKAARVVNRQFIVRS